MTIETRTDYCMAWRLDAEIVEFWCQLIADLLPRLCVVLIIALIAIRLSWFRNAIQADSKVISQLIMVAVFGLFAVVGTHVGFVIDRLTWQYTPNSLLTIKHFDLYKAVVGFRDTWALVAGLTGGFWVGLGAGFLAALDRLAFGGSLGDASAIASLALGMFAGKMRQWANRNTWRVFAVAIMGTLLQRMILLLKPYLQSSNGFEVCGAWELVIRIGIPVAIINITGCVLFVWIMQDLERDRLANDARALKLLSEQAELRALRAQISPHFLNNTLNDIDELIYSSPKTASRYLIELADFFRYTHIFSRKNTVSLKEELEQLERYLHLQRLGFEDKLHDSITVAPDLLGFQVLPSCLMTLVENALKHAFKGKKAPYNIEISVAEIDTEIILQVRDNGRGIAQEQLHKLGKMEIESTTINGGGVALYQLAQSLRLEFGDSAKLTFESSHNGTLASLIFPKRRIS